MSSEIQNKVVAITKDLLTKMGFGAEVKFAQSEEEKQSAVLSIDSPTDSGFLIGKNGNNLEAIEHVVRVLFNKAEGVARTNFILDINDYRKIKTRQLTQTAKEVADRVLATSRAEALDPMTSYERRLVHMELAAYNSLATESIGEEPKRRIVIKPL